LRLIFGVNVAKMAAGIALPHSAYISIGSSAKLEEVEKMATQFCQKCKHAHPGRVCDYDEKGECAETVGLNEVREKTIRAKTLFVGAV
jgi:hypothetical protein